MGILFSSPDSGRAAAETNWATFPPKSGVVFSGHFYLGGEKFDSVARESYIFSDASELHYLNSKPLPLPFGVSRPGHVSRPLRALLNVRKETVRFVKASYETPDGPVQQQYNIEFVFDCLVDCTISLFLFAKESFNGQQLVVEPQNAMHLSPEKAHFAKGFNLVFSKTDVIVKPALYDHEVWEVTDSVFPIVILLEAEEPGEGGFQQQLLLCTAEKQYDNTFALKMLKQKQVIDGIVLVLHDLFGISDREAASLQQLGQEPPKLDDGNEDNDDGSADCVICMVMPRDTLILPCRHLCLCAACADSLRYQASACPICRSPFKALLQLSVLKAVASGRRRRQDNDAASASRHGEDPAEEAECRVEVETPEEPGAGEEMPMRSLQQRRSLVPPGYRSVPILEFVDEQRQQLATAMRRRRTSAANRGRGEAWGTPEKAAVGHCATAGAVASVVVRRPSARRRKSLSSSRSRASNDSRGSSSSENDWADSESGAEEEARAAAANEASASAAASSDALFKMPVTDLALLAPDGDADRGSCSTSTESANSQQQLLAGSSTATATVGKSDAVADSSASAESDFNDTADNVEE